MQNNMERPSNPLEIFIVTTVSCFCIISIICFLAGFGKRIHEGNWGPIFGMMCLAPLTPIVGIAGALVSVFLPPSERTGARTVWKITALEFGVIVLIWLLVIFVPPFR